MSTTIFYYTGTGNSLWVARTMAIELGSTELVSIPAIKEVKNVQHTDSIGIVFPVYIWGVPAPIIQFLNTLTNLAPDYLFAIAVNGGQVANTLVQLKKLLAARSLTLAAGFEVTMPSSYIAWGGPVSQEEQQKLFKAAMEKISRIAPDIRAKKKIKVEKGPLWQRIIFSSMLYKLSFSRVPAMDEQFLVDDKCNYCNLCERVCPAANITLQAGKPVWNHHCEQCFACLQWCPREAIQFGEKTSRYARYHHPEVALKDILQSRE